MTGSRKGKDQDACYCGCLICETYPDGEHCTPCGVSTGRDEVAGQHEC